MSIRRPLARGGYLFVQNDRQRHDNDPAHIYCVIWARDSFGRSGSGANRPPLQNALLQQAAS